MHNFICIDNVSLGPHHKGAEYEATRGIVSMSYTFVHVRVCICYIMGMSTVLDLNDQARVP